MAAAQEERFTRKKHDAAFPYARGRVLPARGGHHRARSDAGRLLREAARQVRAPARDLYGLGAARPALVPDGDAAVARREAVDGRRHPRSARGLRGRGAVRRASRVARGVGVLPVAVRGGGDPHHGRRRRVGDLVDRRRPRQRDRAAARAALPALARPALFGLHLLHRLQGELRRVQGDGPGAVRRADLRRRPSRTTSSRSATTAACG